MLDIRFIRENPELVRENIKKKFQDAKLPLVDEVLELDEKKRAAITEASELRAQRNTLSKQVGMLMGQAKKDPSKLEEAEAIKAKVKAQAERLAELEKLEVEYEEKLHQDMLQIPNIIDPSVPIGPDDSYNVEVQRFGEPKTPDFEIPYHTEIMERFDGVDMDAAGRVSGAGFYYLLGDIARLHEGVLAYARDFMIDKGFTFCIPPFMIHGNVVEGVMSQTDMDAMMYKIEGEDLYLIGTSEHSMVGRFIGEILPEESLPQTLTSYSPCFRKEKGSHGIEERGVYRIHQFEKQEMIVVCKPEDSMKWYEQMWKWSVELFRSMDIPVRQLECCSGDLADLKVKSCDIEAWSPRQQKYFEVCSCSNLGDAQARRLRIRVKGADGRMYLPHTLNNTVVAPPRSGPRMEKGHLPFEDSTVAPSFSSAPSKPDISRVRSDESPSNPIGKFWSAATEVSIRSPVPELPRSSGEPGSEKRPPVPVISQRPGHSFTVAPRRQAAVSVERVSADSSGATRVLVPSASSAAVMPRMVCDFDPMTAIEPRILEGTTFKSITFNASCL